MSDGTDRSVCFDQAADYYDRSRSLPAAGWDVVVEALTSQLSQAALCVDIGIGTGRTALPLARAGIHLVGVDLSIPMLRQLIAKSGGVPLVPIVAGDATALPFRDGSFDAGLIIHVLHSVPRWQGVIGEAVRIMRPGGRIVVDPGVSSNVVSQAIEARFVEELGQEPHRRAWTVETLDETFAGLGCRVMQLPEIQISYRRPLSTLIADLEAGRASWQWSLDRSQFGGAADRVRRWAERRFGPLEEPRDVASAVRMRAYDVPLG